MNVLIVITRMYANQGETGRENDEFVTMFQGNNNDRSKPFVGNDRTIVAIHGSKERFKEKNLDQICDDVAEDIRKEIGKLQSNAHRGVAKIGILYHPGGIKVLEKFNEQIRSKLEYDIEFVRKYGTGEPGSDDIKRLAKQAVDGRGFTTEFDLVWQGGDPLLEAKLELLHMCLTPERAKDLVDQTTKGNPPDQLLSASDKFWDNKLLELNDTLPQKYPKKPYIFKADNEKEKNEEWSVSDLVHALAKQPNGDKKVDYKDKDCFDQEYLTALSALRDALLPDND